MSLQIHFNAAKAVQEELFDLYLRLEEIVENIEDTHGCGTISLRLQEYVDEVQTTSNDLEAYLLPFIPLEKIK